MKILLLLLVLLIAICKVYSQDYDLIVKSNGDSIACHIDSITVTHIYFEMISNNYWIHTHINKVNVIEFQRNVINKKQVVFKSGTSIIEEIREPLESIFDSQRNSICLEANFFLFSLIYERMFPLCDHLGMILGGGYTLGLDFLGSGGTFGRLVGETALSLGGPKHNFESGFLIYFEPEGLHYAFSMVRIGYRFQGYKGFLLRPSIHLVGENVRLCSLSIGYSF